MDRHPFLTVVAAEAAALVVFVAAWNVWAYRAEIAAKVRSAARL